MFVVQIQARGRSAEVRWTSAEAVLGSGTCAGIRREDAGWAEREAVLRHAGTEVLLFQLGEDGREGGAPALHLRVGDAVRIGEAEVSLTGLLPLGSTTAPTPSFGGYDDGPQPAAKFTLEGDLPKPRKRVKLDLPKERFGVMAPAAVPAPAAAPAAAETSSRAKPVWRTDTFEGELVAALRRAPWFALSAVIHAAIAILLLLVLPAPPTTQDLGHGIRDAKIEAHDLDSGGLVDANRPDEPPAEEAAIEPPAEPTDPTPVDDGAQRPQALAPPPQAEPDDAMEPPALIGTSTTIVSMKVKRTGKAEKPSPVLAGADVLNEDKNRAEEQNRKAAAAIRAQIESGGGALGRALRGLAKEDILVVTGSFDEMQNVLDELRVPYTLKSVYEVGQSYAFSRHKYVFWNCGGAFEASSRSIVDGVRDFVRGGGYLFTTDWMVTHLLTPAFPGYLSSPGGRNPLPEMILDVRPRESARESPLLDGVFLPNTKAKWWLESRSFEVIVGRPKDVEVLIESPTLESREWNRSPVLAATFTYGRGRVLHLMGHYYQQKGNVAGTIGAQRLALNFIRMRYDRDHPSASPASDR